MVVILRQTKTEVFDSLPAGPVLRIFMQYSMTYRSLPEAVSDVISGVALAWVGMDVRVIYLGILCQTVLEL